MSLTRPSPFPHVQAITHAYGVCLLSIFIHLFLLSTSMHQARFLSSSLVLPYPDLRPPHPNILPGCLRSTFDPLWPFSSLQSLSSLKNVNPIATLPTLSLSLSLLSLQNLLTTLKISDLHFLAPAHVPSLTLCYLPFSDFLFFPCTLAFSLLLEEISLFPAISSACNALTLSSPR